MTCFCTLFFRGARRAGTTALLAAALGVAAPAQAQFGLPRMNLPTLPSLPRELPRLPDVPAAESARSALALQSLRANSVRELLRDHADALEADPAGEPVRRQELLLIAPAPPIVEAARALGFVVLREQVWAELDLRQLVLRPPPSLGTAEALARLRAVDPQVDADFNHVYTRSGELTETAAGPPASAAASGARRVGLIDSGVDRRHPAFRDADLRAWGCNDLPVPSSHGTAVASLLVGREAAFAGSAPGAVLYAADIYCGQPAAGAVETIAQALAWMARKQVAVVNISLVGPANRLLERVIEAMNRKGHLIVAAVGNDGPAAPALYPAAYAGVVGVTAVTPARRVLPEAAQGAQVMYAAPGSELAVARGTAGYAVARGTSFAAPLVAGLLSESIRRPDTAAARAALQRLSDSALDLGAPGRDPVYGIGLVGERSRVAPDRVHAQGP